MSSRTVDTAKSALEGLASLPLTPRMPLLFVGHGNPMNAIEDNAFTREWRRIGRGLPRPNAIVVMSAHWLTHGNFVTAMADPRTIYDFYGFPPELYRVVYPAVGEVDLAERLHQTYRSMLLDDSWGLDHGAWSVLVHLYPEADIPVLQLSVNWDASPAEQYEFTKQLAQLRHHGVLFIGSGNIVHNLRAVRFGGDNEPYDWAVEFDERTKGLILSGQHAKLIDYPALGRSAQMAVPSSDHYRPMLTTLALAHDGEVPVFFNESIDLASVSMRSFVIS